MSSYIDNSLIKDEKVLYKGEQSPVPIIIGIVDFIVAYILVSMLGGFIIYIAGASLPNIFMLFLIGPMLYLIKKILDYFTTEIAITNKRVIAKFGLISRVTIETKIEKIETIQVRQGIVGRIFNYGGLVVSGAGNPQAPVPGIKSPLDFRRKFNEIQEELEDSK